MVSRIIELIKHTIDKFVDQVYSGNSFSFKLDPIWANVFAISFMTLVDKYVWNIVHFIGTIITLCITLALGTFLPAIYRYYAHKAANKYANKYPIIGEILNHDKKNKTD